MKSTYPQWSKALAVLSVLLCFQAVWAVQVSFPVNFPATRGTTIDIPISIDNTTGLNIYSFELQFTFTSSVMTLVDVLETGALTTGWTANEFHEVNGSTIRIVAAGVTPLTGSGTLVNVRFNLPLGHSGNSNLAWTPASCRLNEGSPTLAFVSGNVVITDLPVLSFYPNTGELFAGDSIAVQVNGGTAPYNFSITNPSIGVFHQNGPYYGYFKGHAPGTTTIQATDNNSISGLSSTFIVRAVKLVIPDSSVLSGRTFLMPVQIQLAGAGAPPAPQALTIQYVQNGLQKNPRLQWTEVSGVAYNVFRSTNPLFLPADPGVTSVLSVTDELPANPALFQFTDTAVNMLDSAKLFYTVTASGIGSVAIYSGQFRITWSTGYLDLVSIQRTGTLTQSWQFQYEPHSGYVDVSFSNQQPLPGSGTLFNLELHVIPGCCVTNLTMSNALFNENQLPIYDNGTTTRITPPSISISPGTAQEIVNGDSIQFSAAGGTAPYTWHITNVPTGNITIGGKFFATGGGLTYVWVNDANGFTDSSALITVDDFRVIAQNLNVARGDSATINLVLQGNTTGLGIYSSDMIVRLSATDWTSAYPIVSGTMMNGWLTAYETVSPTIHIATSNGVPLTGSGTLIQIRGRVPLTATVGAKTIYLDFINLNEGNRRAYKVNGVLTVL